MDAADCGGENISMIELNSREIAILAWLGAILAFAIVKPNVRRAGAGAVRAFFQRKILAVLGMATFYVTGCVWLLHRITVWQWDNLKTTILWGLTFALVTMMDVKQLEQGPKALKALAKDALSATAVIVFIAEFYTLPLWGELLLVPVLVLIGGMLAVAQRQPEHAIVIKPLLFVQTLAGLGILAFGAYHIIQDLRGFATVGTAREFGVPILLSLMFLPFLFGLGLVIGYENAGLRLYMLEDRALARYAFFRGMLAFRTNVGLFQRFTRNIQLGEIGDKDGVRRTIRELRTLRRREKNPPPVPWSEGWSPYKARTFLADQNLTTNDYHRSGDDWWAESPMLDIGGGLFPDRLTYRLGGTETATTKLSLELNANTPGTPEVSDQRFWEAARLLVTQAVDAQAAETFAQACGQDEATIRVGDTTATIRRDDWGNAQRGGYSRRLTIRHPAHGDMFPGLD